MAQVEMTEEGHEIIEIFLRFVSRINQLKDIRDEIRNVYYEEYITQLEVGEATGEFTIDETTREYQGVRSIQSFLIRQRVEAMEDMLVYGFKSEKPIRLYRGLSESRSEPENEEFHMSGFIFFIENSPLAFVCEVEGNVYVNEVLNDMNFTLLREYDKDANEWGDAKPWQW